ncbi:MAG: hypothetical protein C4325_04345 [Blastocatellia bacterium]
MSPASKEWIFLLSFFACFFFVLIAESKWLILRKSGTLRNVSIAVAGSDLLAITAGLLLAFVIFGAVAAYAFGAAPPVGDDPRFAFALLASVIGPLMVLFVSKLILLRLLRISPPLGITPFAFFSAAIFVLIVFGTPSLILFLLREL